MRNTDNRFGVLSINDVIQESRTCSTPGTSVSLVHCRPSRGCSLLPGGWSTCCSWCSRCYRRAGRSPRGPWSPDGGGSPGRSVSRPPQPAGAASGWWGRRAAPCSRRRRLDGGRLLLLLLHPLHPELHLPLPEGGAVDSEGPSLKGGQWPLRSNTYTAILSSRRQGINVGIKNDIWMKVSWKV